MASQKTVRYRVRKLAAWSICVALSRLAFVAVASGQTGASLPHTSHAPVVRESPATISFVQPPDLTEPQDPDDEPLAEPSLDAFSELQQLLSEPVLMPGPPPATLTQLETGQQTAAEAVTAVPRTTPAAVTRIDADTIRASGARSLNELLDIYVPNVQIIRHNSGMDRMGIRGIIKDRDDSYLLTVNGRVMNHRSQEGAMSERDLPMLGDIHHIDFVRGPGSAIYGPGAVAGVISIVTHNGLTLQGTDTIVRQGFYEDFTSVELRHGHQFDDDTGLFLYYGYSDYPGADQDAAPYVFGSTFTPRGGGPPIPAGEPVPFDINDDHRAYRSMGKHKLHAQYTDGPLDAWVRYTVGGSQTPPSRSHLAERPIGRAKPSNSMDERRATQMGYQQLTMFAEYTLDLSENWDLEYRISYDIFDFERILERVDRDMRSHREDEFYTRLMARWSPNPCHTAAIGVAYSWEHFGLKSPGFPNEPANTQRQPDVVPWKTDTISLLGEYRWKPTDTWMFYVGGRTDDHTYTETLFSPRVAAVYTPTERDTIKCMLNRAVRRSGDDELRAEYLNSGTFSDEEQIKAIELRYERQQTEPLWLATSFFGQDVGLVARDSKIRRNVRLGTYQNWGVEVEAIYRTDTTRFVASHAYTKLVGFELADPDTLQGLSSRPYGFGEELANWSPNLTKLYVAHDLNTCWSVSSSLRVYWGFPGAADQAEYNAQILADTGLVNGSMAYVDPGNYDPFLANVYWNTGLERRFSDRCAIRLDLYNILGWFDIDLNKRNYVLRASEWRAEAPAIGVSGRFVF